MFLCRATAPLEPRPPQCWGSYMTLSQYDSSQQVISSSPQDLLTAQKTNTRDEHIHDLSGNRTRDPSNRAAILDRTATGNMPAKFSVVCGFCLFIKKSGWLSRWLYLMTNWKSDTDVVTGQRCVVIAEYYTELNHILHKLYYVAICLLQNWAKLSEQIRKPSQMLHYPTNTLNYIKSLNC